MKSITAEIEPNALKCEMAAQVLRSSGRLRLGVTGWSMLPTIWPGDTLAITRTDPTAISVGDIVLCARARRFSVHRVVEKNESTILTRGDAMLQPDPPVASSDVLGKVSYVLRDGERIEPRKTFRLSERAVAALTRRSHLAARVSMALHNLRERRHWKRREPTNVRLARSLIN